MVQTIVTQDLSEFTFSKCVGMQDNLPSLRVNTYITAVKEVKMQYIKAENNFYFFIYFFDWIWVERMWPGKTSRKTGQSVRRKSHIINAVHYENYLQRIVIDFTELLFAESRLNSAAIHTKYFGLLLYCVGNALDKIFLDNAWIR